MGLPRSCVECTVRGPHCFCDLNVDGDAGPVSRAGAGTGGGFTRGAGLCGLQGALKLTTSSRDGRLLLLRIAGPGDVLGLASVLKATNHEVTAEALEECEVRVIAREDFIEFMNEFREVGWNSAEAVAREYGSAVLSARRLALSRGQRRPSCRVCR